MVRKLTRINITRISVLGKIYSQFQVHVIMELGDSVAKYKLLSKIVRAQEGPPTIQGVNSKKFVSALFF